MTAAIGTRTDPRHELDEPQGRITVLVVADGQRRAASGCARAKRTSSAPRRPFGERRRPRG